MTERFVVSNITQFSGIVQKKPEILGIPVFSGLRKVFTPAPTTGCKCNSNKLNLADHRASFEAALAVLSTHEQNTLKTILDTKLFCFYRKEANGQLKLNCF